MGGTISRNAASAASDTGMSSMSHHPRLLAARTTGASAWLVLLIRAAALCGLLLLPVQVRAGAAHPHPHALLHLLLDARDASLVHHGEPVDAAASQQPDIPAFESSVSTAGALAILAAFVTAVTVPRPPASRTWARLADWHDRPAVLKPPPPRPGRG
jgi:hypothetical protein